MKILLPLGETLVVGLSDSDGEFKLSYGGLIDSHLTIHAEMPDTSGRVDLIYDEDFSNLPGDLEIPSFEESVRKIYSSTGEDDPTLRPVDPVRDQESSPQSRLHHLGMGVRENGLAQALLEVYGTDHTLLARDLIKAASHA